MRNLIIESTRESLAAVSHPRFFRSERGYQGRFYCALQAAFDKRGLLDDGARIIELEYQKGARHGMSQRPDIIYHIPVEVSGKERWANNYAVWALKLESSARAALDDFEKLDGMFASLHYPVGFFININSQQDFLEHYPGSFRDRLYGYCVWLERGQPMVRGRSCGDVRT
jgi:hypothetical protein